MKKLLLFFIGLALAVCSSVSAQDTIDGRQQDTNRFFYGCWPDLYKNMHTFTPFGGFYGSSLCGGEELYYYHTDSAITIYGIAAGLIENFPEESVYDTSYDRCIQYLTLSIPQADTVLRMRQGEIHMQQHTPVSFYAHFPSCFHPNYYYVPFFERYFDSSYTVTGTFYAGITLPARQPYMAPDGHRYVLEFRQFYPLLLNVDTDGPRCKDTVISKKTHCNDSTTWSKYNENNITPMIFPILVPPDFGVIDTLSIADPDIMNRMTGVMPNPASESAKIVSSFGLSYIEIYNASGAKIFDQPAHGYSVTVNTSRWPAGVYVVHIHTPLGIATKRLNIVR